MPTYKFVQKVNENTVHAMKVNGLRTLCGQWALFGYEEVEEGVQLCCMECIGKLVKRIPGLWAAITFNVQEISK